MNNKTIIEFGFRVIWRIIKASVCVILLSFASADNTNLGLDNSSYHTQPHSIIVNYIIFQILETLAQNMERMILKCPLT